MLGGRAAEEIVYGTKTTGAESDIEQATELARRIVTRWGMSERLGLVQLAPRENPYLNNTLDTADPSHIATKRRKRSTLRSVRSLATATLKPRSV